ncbi:DUF5655 domain-containing protein [Inhella gelatinilytica]|uniref:DUF4287 domain-containing protein n=1 Tax=Inhella gelatinilytica TaxID=2795030 RepID=A0A931IXX3_9BURK|nr:DUF5655 domain-containing protein [Inhella gelatinilytica]MBH9552038.1 DUF4287 domain-containing protein [Inhella gelatinilytica]
MADPTAALLTQLKNIQTKTGHSLAQLHQQLQGCGLAKHSEKRAWLMERFSLGYGDANTVVTLQGKPVPAGLEGAPTSAPETVADDPLDALYSGKKAALRPLHDAVMAQIQTLGPFEVAPKKAYLSLRRSKQFAMVGPATVSEVEIGLNCKTLPEHPRLKALPPGGMCQATTRIRHVDEVDANLLAWIRAAFDAAA